ncbi:MAG: c-type cytochrome [Planctomycetaceae bacterium]|nr:c-type cytochrome [Planctomycetaceae bacterium]
MQHFFLAEPRSNRRASRFLTWFLLAMGIAYQDLHADNDLPGGGQATAVESITLPAGFHAQLLRSARQGEGSWISMTFDDRGRVIIGRDKRGIVRMTLNDEHQSIGEFEVLENTLQHCRGVLHAHDSLYVCATNSRGFYRLRDTNGDDQYDKIQKLKSMDYQSRYGHGTNQVVLGPDEMIYVVNGNDVAFPKGVATNSPYRNPQDDHLLPEFRDAVDEVRVGHILRTDPEGRDWEVIAGGFRNPVDLAFNQDGEMFTYDADMEWDVGLPWYRPTRLNHVVSGGEYGWRWGTGKWPAYFADSLPSTLNTGLGSPTGIEFGTHSHFPSRYRASLFMGDWQNGRILEVKMSPSGVTYSCQYQVFLEGGALNICDLTFGPDGAMYFITGGRGSQSGLYRISYQGPEEPTISPSEEDRRHIQAASQSRQIRHQLETFHSRQDIRAINAAWPHLNSKDRWLRFAARLAIERQTLAWWRERALQETRPNASIAAKIALARRGRPEDQTDLLIALEQLSLKQLDREQLLDALRLYELVFIRQGSPSAKNSDRALRQLDSLFPHPSSHVNRELCRLLIYLQAPKVVPRTVDLIRKSISQEDAIFYSQLLARMNEGWTAETRETFFNALIKAQQYQGGKLLTDARNAIREDAISTLTKAEQEVFAPYLNQLKEAEKTVPDIQAAPFVKQWSWQELEAKLPQIQHDRSWEQGGNAFAKASCIQCHRLGEQGTFTGPDLTHVGRRFDERALLESILLPSKAMDDKYRLSNYLLTDGKIVTGRPVGVSSTVITLQVNPLDTRTIEVLREQIEETSPSRVSPMPSGLVNVLTLDEILDLIVYLKSGGDPMAAIYQSNASDQDDRR